MKRIGKWVICDGHLFNLETLQLLDQKFLGQNEADADFLQTTRFGEVVRSKCIPRKNRLRNHEILVLEVTDKCNYTCQGCFEGKSVQSGSVMDLGVACKLIGQLDPGSEVRFFGGEPLLEFDFVVQVVKKFPYLQYSLVTNGSLITEEMARFFADCRFSVGVSYDGMAWQKESRVCPDGDSLADFRRCMKICDKAGLKVGISTVVRKESLSDLYDIHLETFSDYDIKGWAYLLCYTDTLTLGDLDVFGDQILGIVNDFPAEHLTKINDLWKWSMKVSGEWPMDSFCGAGVNYGALTVHGEKRLCPFFMREGSCFVPEIRAVEVDCSKCHIWNFCHGGCLALNRFTSGNTHKGHPFSCKKNRIYFEAGLKTRIKISEATERKGG